MAFIPVTVLNDPALDLYARRTERELLRYNEPMPGLFVVESPVVIERAIDGGYEPVSLLVDESKIEIAAVKIIEKCRNVPIYTAKTELLENLTGFPLTRGAQGIFKRKEYPKISDVICGTRRVVILEDVENPTNVGAIFRSAAALNVDAVLLTQGCADPLYRRAARVSMGTVFQIPWTYFGKNDLQWPAEALEYLKNKDFISVAMALEEDSVSVDDERLSGAKRLAILLGAEGTGLNAQTVTLCDMTVCIPMSHGVDSLNVSAAGAVAFWAMCRS